MVIGWATRADDADPEKGTRSAWQQVEETQLRPQLPCLLVPQPAHAVLAGHLAEGLLPEFFGELPREIKQAILMHDTGWATLDAAQIQRLRSVPKAGHPATPVSFVSVAPHEIADAWTASILHAEHISAAAGLVVSRHFLFLARASAHEYKNFLAAEEARQGKLEAVAKASSDDLERWTNALGFCDIASLYLITGLKTSGTSFPLVHPASPSAHTAPSTVLRWKQDLLEWSPSVFAAGLRAEIDALRHPVVSDGPRSEHLSWEFA